MNRLIGLFLGLLLGAIVGRSIGWLIVRPDRVAEGLTAGFRWLAFFLINGSIMSGGGVAGCVFGPRLLKNLDLREQLRDPRHSTRDMRDEESDRQ